MTTQRPQTAAGPIAAWMVLIAKADALGWLDHEHAADEHECRETPSTRTPR